MPELPEVETIRLYLETRLFGKKLFSISILEPRSFFGNPNTIIGAKIKNITRKGKILTLEAFNLKNKIVFINIHLKLSGQLLFASNAKKAVYPNKIPGKTTRVILQFDDGSALFFNDLRKFGWIKLTASSIAPKGKDVLSKDFTEDYFHKILQKTSRNIKTAIMDQEKIAGIGNIYANDSLWHAKIHPSTNTSKITQNKKHQLYTSIIAIINEAITKKGSSARDELYILPDGTKGNYQNFFKVYGRKDEPCPTCKTRIVRIKIAGRGTFFCPQCQSTK